jgi:branched-chain amino acid transport system permease protein
VTDSTPHSSGTPASGPAVGQDEWVARHAERRFVHSKRLAPMEDRLRAIPWWAWLTLFVGFMCLLPAVSGSGYVRRVGFDTVLYMMLALGLNVVVGWGGLLDLGYVAFYGLGAYSYAVLDSNQFHLHLPAYLAIAIVVVIGAIAGFLLGLPSRRLHGDYLAIVTLFFLQLFQTIATNGDNIFGHNVTGGAFGIFTVRPLHAFGHNLAVQHSGVFAVSYYYVALAFFAAIYVALRFVNLSRTGRAWRSLREDPLAAEAMGMPVNTLKLMAFSFGAAIAALTGTLFASLSASVLPQTFYFVLLITVYTMVILGGAGSQQGVVLGALVIGPLLELLRDPNKSRVIFYIALVGGLLFAFRLSKRLALVVGGTLALGFISRAIVAAIHPSWVAGSAGGGLQHVVSYWVIIPRHLPGWVPPVTYVGVIALALLLTLVHGWVRLVLLPPTLCLAAFVWDNVMLTQPDPARYIVLGLILICLMILRPNGLLGERRVEIV